jgi:hypothetical protein
MFLIIERFSSKLVLCKRSPCLAVIFHHRGDSRRSWACFSCYGTRGAIGLCNRAWVQFHRKGSMNFGIVAVQTLLYNARRKYENIWLLLLWLTLVLSCDVLCTGICDFIWSVTLTLEIIATLFSPSHFVTRNGTHSSGEGPRHSSSG